ncbi:PCI domain protein [Ichthyophthirius multifiliis]|uniref:PCI domain protein n=1 Tax=Ichthyophthirius multifiliis TaxID=5932 RepID=G0QPM3_ICHMU|nr:PCI domain protein [Ichthyophthirius multifiliis]EGR32823.1 PCI domain protein [Ichthyophthirius multifiliis]|eukprot:XP_004036809.1 PCI domain protein [Ichthyophthirius multifiliis]
MGPQKETENKENILKQQEKKEELKKPTTILEELKYQIVSFDKSVFQNDLKNSFKISKGLRRFKKYLKSHHFKKIWSTLFPNNPNEYQFERFQDFDKSFEENFDISKKKIAKLSKSQEIEFYLKILFVCYLIQNKHIDQAYELSGQLFSRVFEINKKHFDQLTAYIFSIMLTREKQRINYYKQENNYLTLTDYVALDTMKQVKQLQLTQSLEIIYIIIILNLHNILFLKLLFLNKLQIMNQFVSYIIQVELKLYKQNIRKLTKIQIKLLKKLQIPLHLDLELKYRNLELLQNFQWEKFLVEIFLLKLNIGNLFILIINQFKLSQMEIQLILQIQLINIKNILFLIKIIL